MIAIARQFRNIDADFGGTVGAHTLGEERQFIKAVEHPLRGAGKHLPRLVEYIRLPHEGRQSHHHIGQRAGPQQFANIRFGLALHAIKQLRLLLWLQVTNTQQFGDELAIDAHMTKQ